MEGSKVKERVVGAGLLLTVGAALLLTLWFASVLLGLSRGDAVLLLAICLAAMPVVFVAGFLLGRVYARERVAGLDTGIERVMKAAGETAALRVNVLRATQQAKNPVPPTIIELPPEPDFVDAPRLGSGDDGLVW